MATTTTFVPVEEYLRSSFDPDEIEKLLDWAFLSLPRKIELAENFLKTQPDCSSRNLEIHRLSPSVWR